MYHIPLHDLRRIAAVLATLRGRTIAEMTTTADLRQLKLSLDDGEMLVVRIETDDLGRSHLEVDVARAGDLHREQLEVGLV